MKKRMSMLLFTCCIAIMGAGCGGNTQQDAVEEATTQASQETTTEDTRHIHTWTAMQNDTQSWEECEECGAKKNIADIVTEAPTEVTTEATTEATTEESTEAAPEEATTEKKKEENKKEKKKENKKKEKTRDDYKTDNNYEWYMRNGEGGENFSYTMKVIQTVDEGVYLCDLGSSYSGNMVFVYMDTNSYTKELTGGQRIIEDDVIRVYGTFESTYIYQTANGESKESLVVKAVFVDIQ